MNRGEIWLVSLDPTIGAEIRKTRPAVIVNDDNIGILPLKIIVPITEWNARYATFPWFVRVDPESANGLQKPSAVDTFQVRSVSNARLVRRVGSISTQQLQEIEHALAIVLGLR